LRLHPYHAERIFARVAALAPIVPLVASHHERVDGRGYYRGLSGEQIPLGARVIAVADAFDELSHATPTTRYSISRSPSNNCVKKPGTRSGLRRCMRWHRSLARLS